MRQRGFTLLEITVVTIIMGLLVAMVAPTYRQAVEQARVDMCVERLRSIWSAQRLHWLEHRSYAASLDALDDAGLLDRASFKNPEPFSFQVVAVGESWTAEAQRQGSAWTGTISIDDEGILSGYVEDAGGRHVMP